MAGGIAYPLMEDEAGLKETLARLEATDITAADLEVVAFRPETEIASFAAFFETGARLGAENILIAAYDPDLTRFTDRYAAFCEAAAPYGLTADLEFRSCDLCFRSGDGQQNCLASRAAECRRPRRRAALRQVE